MSRRSPVLAALLSLQCLTAAWVSAQEVMEFEPVPAESAVIERDRVRQGRRVIPPVPPVVPEARQGDIVRIGSDIHIQKDQVVEGDVFALRGDIRVDGHVRGDVAATGGDLHLGPTARVDGDVMCIGGVLEEDPGARVGGQRVTALHGGRRPRRIDVRPDRMDWESHGRAGDLSAAFSWLLVSLLLAWAITRFASTRTSVALATLKQAPGMSLLLGVGLAFLLAPSVVAMALVVAILCITIIGIPLALGVILAYAVLLMVLVLWGYVVGAIPVGERLAVRLGKDASALSRVAMFGVLGIGGLKLLAELFHFLPLFGWFANLLWVVGFVASAVVTLMGAGALIRSKFGQGVDGRWWPLFNRAPRVPAVTAPESSPPPSPTPGGPPSEPSPAA
jgi:hypothetical protein